MTGSKDPTFVNLPEVRVLQLLGGGEGPHGAGGGHQVHAGGAAHNLHLLRLHLRLNDYFGA